MSSRENASSAQIQEPLRGVSLSLVHVEYQITVRPGSRAENPPRILEINGGTIQLDGRQMPNPKLGDYFLSWSEPAFPGATRARLQISKDRYWFEGLIGKRDQTGKLVLYEVFGAAAPLQVTLADGRKLAVRYAIRPDSGTAYGSRTERRSLGKRPAPISI
jgi:hypothetical protein